MHISEGVLPPLILAGSACLTVAGTAIGLRKLDYDNLVTVAILAAAFFVASLIHVPIGPTSAHLILNGLLGVIMGWAAFPAILVGLTLQAMLFQFGGLTTLGANTLNMALPPVLCFYIFRPMLGGSASRRSVAAFACGATAVGLSAVFTAATLALAGDAFFHVAQVLLLSSIPVMLIEGVITAGIVGFLAKVRPEVLFFASAPGRYGITSAPTVPSDQTACGQTAHDKHSSRADSTGNTDNAAPDSPQPLSATAR
ncbi:cobalt transporter CbiM [Desulfovibrio psychrotolerans]|uniref:Cobalt transporter CbiM n=1 Tax=Desulfovibrio psychrotolerans TaxID=415242 RepID=A0A7J0BQ39_9BACT|nr:cobalt transporter CbiM [Desulfovibrio psychrotolerans]